MILTDESKLLLGILAGTVLLVIGAIALFSRPAAPTPAIPVEKLVLPASSRKGPDQASVVLVEFSDFQCPACLAAKPYIDTVLAKYATSVQFVYRHFPLDQHPYGKKAAQAAEAAGLQGKFWDMYDGLFAKQASLSDETVRTLAKTLQLEIDTFERDWKSASVAAIVEKDRADGITFGVNATPTFFLNGRKMELASFGDLVSEVEKALNTR